MPSTTKMDDCVNCVFLNFDTVFPGRKFTKSFKLDNRSKKTKTYVIVPVNKDKANNTGCERVKIKPEKAVVSPGKSVNIVFTYLSHLENVTDNVAYEIFDSDNCLMRVNVHARSIGPLLSPSIINVAFHWFRDVKETVKHVEVINAAHCEAKFLFDSDEDNDIIDISQLTGVIPVSGRINIKLTFRPKECGIYYKRIFCLVQFHKPIVLNVLGIHNPKLRMNPKTFVYKYPFPRCRENTYRTYITSLTDSDVAEDEFSSFRKCLEEYRTRLDDSLVVSEEIQQAVETSVYTKNEIVLTKHFVDMKNLSEIHQATALVNLSKIRRYFYCWDHDSKNNFQVEPCRGFLSPGTTLHFGIRFQSHVPDQLFSSCIDVRVFPPDEDDEISDQSVHLPLTMTLRIIGNSFPNDSSGWVPQCTVVPKSLRLPSCAPGQIVYGNFLIERRGHLPVTFQVILPSESRFTVQPQLGCIRGNFQLFVVEFNGERSQEVGTFEENLRIHYNHSAVNCDCLRLSVSVEIPRLRFGTENSFSFQCTFPGSKAVAEIPVDNLTNLHLKYEFVIPEDVDWIEIKNPVGSIEPTSSFLLKAVFKPDSPHEYLDYIECNVLTLSDSSDAKPEVMQFQIIGSCQFGYLVATPNFHDFGECIYGVEQSIQIDLFNFSPVNLNFRLFPAYRAFPVGNVVDDVTVNPSRGVVPGKGSRKISITIVPHGQDVFQYSLVCQVLDTDSEDARPCEKGRKIFLIRFEGVLPTFQIIDLSIDNGGPLFSPHWCWKMMAIDDLNKALKSPMSHQKINLRFPEAMTGSPPITLTLLAEARRFEEVAWSLDRRIFCPCMGDSSDPVSCMHSNAVKWAPSKGILSPGNRSQMTIVLGYEHPDEFVVQWTMNLPCNRKIVLEAAIVSLPEDEPSFTSMYMSPVLHLKPIFMGDVDPPVQLFWLYNNTHRSTSYVVDKSTLREATASPPRVFDCLNSNGVIPPFSCVPLIFSFKPNEMITYMTEFLVCTRQDMPTKITLKGDGVLQAEQIKELSMERTVPEKSFLVDPNVDLRISVNFLNIPYVQVFSDAKRIFFLRNTSKVEAWAFQWHSFRVGKLIEARITPHEGIIEPGNQATMTLVVTTKCKPTSISISVPCDVINYARLKEYKSAVRFKKETEEKAKDYFTVVESGTFYEEPNVSVPEEPAPKHLFLTVNVNIVSRINVDQKLLLKQQMSLKSSREIVSDVPPVPEIARSMVPCIQNLLEKILWNILNKKIFRYRIKSSEPSLDYDYDQIQPETDRKTINDFHKLSAFLDRNAVQNYLETIIKNILIKNLQKNSENSNGFPSVSTGKKHHP